MSGWIAWVIAACVFGVGELLATNLLLAPFALGAALAAVVDVSGAGGLVAWIVFILGSLLILALVRPIARSRRPTPQQIRAGAAALVGRQATVLERIVNDEGVGCIKVDGEVWTARALGDEHVIDTGRRVRIIDIKGATALVTE